MKKDIAKIIQRAPATIVALSELDQLIGERRAFSRVSDSCSAADASLLRRIRDGRLYAAKGVNWDEFCPRYLDISKTEANRIIRRFEEFGESYFDLSRIVRISPESYRAIAPAIKDKTIEWNGERISLAPENAQRVHAAVTALRQEAGVKRLKPAKLPQTPPAPVDRIAELETASTAIVKELLALCRTPSNGRFRQRIQSLAQHVRMRMKDVEDAAV
jgi:hypothetical protein